MKAREIFAVSICLFAFVAAASEDNFQAYQQLAQENTATPEGTAYDRASLTC